MVSAAVRRLRTDETGFGLIELLMAMGILAIAISAQLAVFSSSYTSLSRANMKGTAVTVADKQMETYRTLPVLLHLPHVRGAATARTAATAHIPRPR